MKSAHPEHPAPADAPAHAALPPVVCYPVEGLPQPDLGAIRAARDGWRKVS